MLAVKCATAFTSHSLPVICQCDNRGSPAWHGTVDTGLVMEPGASADQVNELLASNQRAFAARFASAATEGHVLSPDAAAAAAVEASLLMPPPPPVPTTSSFDAGTAPAAAPWSGLAQDLLPVADNSTHPHAAPLAAAQEQQRHAAASSLASGAGGNPTGHLGGVGTAGQLGATGLSSSSTSKRRTNTKKAAGPSAKGGGGRWTKEEDAKLRVAVQTVGATNWKLIATEYLNDNRSDVQCLHRWQKVLQPGLVKGPWTKEEDQIIIDCIEAGLTKWAEIADRIPGRIGKQCRERWFNHLDPSLKKGGWTEEEDAILVEAQAKWGNSWTKIAKLLPGRSENAVKNRWNSATRRRQKATVKTTDKIAADAIALVNAADAADKAAERERSGPGGVASRGHAEDEDTECVPRSAIALLRAKREEARRAMELGLPPPDNAIGLGLHLSGPVIHPKTANPAMDIATLPMVGYGDLSSDKSDDEEDEEGDEDDEDVAGEPDEVGDGMMRVECADDEDDLKAQEAGLHGASGDPMVDHLLTDSTLTDREKELIYRAYLAGIAQSGGSNGPSPPGSAERKGSSGGTKLKFKRGGRGGAAAGSPVQWDFQSEAMPQGSGSGNAAIPDGFLQEYGIDFPDDVEQVSGGNKRGELEDDLELSSSLLTMSLDQDIPIDTMELSAGERSLLGRPMAQDTMASIVGSHEHLAEHLVGIGATARRGGGSRRVRPTRAAHEAGPSHSPAGPLVHAATQPAFGIETGGAGAASDSVGGRPHVGGVGHAEASADCVSPTTFALGGFDRRGGGPLSDAQRAELMQSQVKLVKAQHLSPSGESPSGLSFSLDMFDSHGIADFGSSGDLGDLTGSPHLWSVGSSSISPTNSGGGMDRAPEEAAVTAAAPVGF